MSDYEAGPRKLSWPLLNPLVDQSTTEEDADCSGSSFVWPEDSDERVPIVFNLSLNEFVVLASTIDVGRDIAYGEDSLRVWWLWDRVLRCPMSLCDAIANAINTCENVQTAILELVGNAIGNPSTLQEQLRTFVVGDQLIRDYVQTVADEEALSIQVRDGNMLIPDACGDGYLYSQVKAAADELETMSGSFFTAINVATTIVQAASIVLTIVPWLGGPLASIVLQEIAEALLEEFQAAYTTASGEIDKTALYCELWCEVKGDCELSLDQLISFYVSKMDISISTDPAQAVLDMCAIIRGDGALGENAYYAMHVFMLVLVRVSQNILGVDFGQFALTVSAAGVIDDSGYLDCEECPEIEGDWRIYTEYMSEPLGVIIHQEALQGVFEAQEGSDGLWRVAIFNTVDCCTLTALDLDGSTGDHGCHGWVGGPPFVGGTNFQDRIYLEKSSAFTLTIEYMYP